MLKDKVALILGITGQDGAYLSKMLIDKGYVVHGVRRLSSTSNVSRLDYIFGGHLSQKHLHLHYGDVTDSSFMVRIIAQIKPDEIYNLAAQSHVQVSFKTPEFTANVDGLGVLNVIEAARHAHPKARIYQASTSELFGLVTEPIQDENTAFYPRSPYAVAKLYGYWICKNYREAYDMFISNGILFNHESPLRGTQFVTRKVTRSVARICHGLCPDIALGNLDAKRDWGHAKDYVDAMWRILQHSESDDFVIATGTATSVRQFVVAAFQNVGLKISWTGSGLDETAFISECEEHIFQSKIGSDPKDLCGKTVVRIDPFYFRPTEVDLLHGDPSKAKRLLGWQPHNDLSQLIDEMVDFDLSIVKKEILAGVASHLDTV